MHMKIKLFISLDRARASPWPHVMRPDRAGPDPLLVGRVQIGGPFEASSRPLGIALWFPSPLSALKVFPTFVDTGRSARLRRYPDGMHKLQPSGSTHHWSFSVTHPPPCLRLSKVDVPRDTCDRVHTSGEVHVSGVSLEIVGGLEGLGRHGDSSTVPAIGQSSRTGLCISGGGKIGETRAVVGAGIPCDVPRSSRDGDTDRSAKHFPHGVKVLFCFPSLSVCCLFSHRESGSLLCASSIRFLHSMMETLFT